MKSKKNMLRFGIIYIVTIMICHNFLQMHYSSDTYVLYDLGYMSYPAKYFLLDGRIISTLVCYAAGIFKIPISVYIVGMDFIGITFVALSVYSISKAIEKIVNPKNNILKFSIIAGSFVLILNQFALEYLLFPESGVMCFGLFCIVLASINILSESKYKYLKIFIYVLIGGISYQGLLNIFPVLSILMYIMKQIYDEKPAKIRVKEFFAEMIKLAIIVIIVLIICLLVVKVGKTALNSNQDRGMHLINSEAVLLRAETVGEYMEELWKENQHMLPTNMSTAILIMSFILLIMLNPKKWTLIQYTLLILLVFFICIVPMFLFNTGICGRVNVPLQMLWGGSILILLAQTNVTESEVKKKIIYVFVVLSFVINVIFLMQNIAEHIAANRVDQEMGLEIKTTLEKYEKETGITVTKFSYFYDKNPQQFATSIRPIGSLTERAFGCSWSVRAAMDFYCNRNFVKGGFKKGILEARNISWEDNTSFSINQLFFDEDTMYLIIY